MCIGWSPQGDQKGYLSQQKLTWKIKMIYEKKKKPVKMSWVITLIKKIVMSAVKLLIK